MSSDAWSEYAHYARRLDEVRAEEGARTAGMRQGVAEMSAHADELEARLLQQQSSVLALSSALRYRRPPLDPIPPGETAATQGDQNDQVAAPQPLDPAPALGRIAAAIDTAEREATEAGRRGLYPALLPGVRGMARGLLVYGVAALAVLGVQTLAFSRAGTETSPITVLFLLPLVGFALGYAVLKLGSRTRVAREPADGYARLGLLLCFLIGPIGAAATVLSSTLRR